TACGPRRAAQRRAARSRDRNRRGRSRPGRDPVVRTLSTPTSHPSRATESDMTEEPLEPPAAEGEPPTSEPPAEADADTGANAAAHTAVGALQTRVAELEDLLLRALADADNMRKRVAREIEQAREDERARVAELWLPVVDNLDRALEHADA